MYNSGSSFRTGSTTVDIKLEPSAELQSIYQKNLWRKNPHRRPAHRYSTRIPSVDKWLGGGLPTGLVIAYGSAGAGKSLFSRQIAIRAPKALYIACEVIGDAPLSDKYPNVISLDFTTYTPNWVTALKVLSAFQVYEQPSIIIIDSITSFLGVTKKAVPEAELRTSIGLIHRLFDRMVPIIGISEVRQGFNEYPAGGSGVAHSNSMLLHFQRIPIRFRSDREMYGLEAGDVLYTVEVEKDKDGLARTDVARVIYNKSTGDYRWASLRNVEQQYAVPGNPSPSNVRPPPLRIPPPSNPP